MRKLSLCLLLGGIAGCAGEGSGTSSGTGSTSAASSAASTSASAAGSSTGRETTSGSSTGTTSAGTTGGTTASSTGSASGGQTSTGSAAGGSSSGGTSSGGSSTGGAAVTLAQACTDYIAGEVDVTTCLGSMSQAPSVQECETILAVCTAADCVIIDGMGLCLEALTCEDPLDEEMSAEMCTAAVSTLTVPCQNAGMTGPPDGGDLGDPDAGGGESTTGGGRGG